MIEINLAAQTLFEISGVPITNSMVTAFTITVVFALFALIIRRKFALVPTKVQLSMELAAGFIMDLLETSFGSKEKARRYFPLLMTLILFITVANQFTIIPLVSNFVLGDTPLFRLPTSDLGQTVTLAVAMILLSHILVLRVHPLKHIGSFIRIAPLFKARSVGDVGNALLGIFLGLLDIIGEFAKVLSLSFRLFGNIFAGEAIIAVIGGLSAYTAFIVPIPFMILSIFSGFVQAFVFTLLSTQFLAPAIQDQN